ncbi:DUF3846 domain-containing protein [Streptomyces lunaelactis]|uniref:DUF3846 domain-containing protein n=1 Tax=Streptomyces lunaelactis TaxID=1535768 RepID=UPI0015856CE3|nr:DUF3846 domain-containing protein [Streptomyces lunaelactis]NUK14923.1 DUF3846 domain-containing protein [Streptomyces lunaelactis]NUK22116.1 DUF3846 domain-containing protein [Streptomyces lunaelactis]
MTTRAKPWFSPGPIPSAIRNYGRPTTVVDLGDDGAGSRFLRSLRAIIGAECAECVAVTDRWDAWLDEESAVRRRPLNEAATRLAHDYGARVRLRGTVVIVGADRGANVSVGLSPDQIDTLRCRATDAPRC